MRRARHRASDRITHPVGRHVYAMSNDLESLCRRLLDDYPFAAPHADAVLTRRNHIAMLFGYTRSCFHADLTTVGDTVVFLHTLLPNTPIDWIYTILGRAKQGKTERYRHFFRHLGGQPNEHFVHADGERGMVMLVFTLTSCSLVFKLIRDRFAYSKDMARSEVQANYRLMFHHDRVGRLVDAQESAFYASPRRSSIRRCCTSCCRAAANRSPRLAMIGWWPTATSNVDGVH